MSRTITIDGITLNELRIVPNPSGDLVLHAVFALTSGSQVVATLNRTVTTMLTTNELSTVRNAFTAIEAAIARDQAS